MNARLKAILEEAQKLDASERQELVRLLLSTPGGEEPGGPSETPADSARAVQAKYLDV